VVKSRATQAQFFSTFADYVAGEPDIDHTQLMVKTCTKAMHKAGVTAPANYDSVMEPYLNVNAKIDDALRAKIVAELRGLAK
jgi:hypothetical protein